MGLAHRPDRSPAQVPIFAALGGTALPGGRTRSATYLHMPILVRVQGKTTARTVNALSRLSRAQDVSSAKVLCDTTIPA